VVLLDELLEEGAGVGQGLEGTGLILGDEPAVAGHVGAHHRDELPGIAWPIHG